MTTNIRHVAGFAVSIAFRLGKWLVVDADIEKRGGTVVGLNCLSAWEVVGRNARIYGNARVFGSASQLPFGLGSGW